MLTTKVYTRDYVEEVSFFFSVRVKVYVQKSISSLRSV